MSEILANIVVQPVDIVINAENNQINFTPEDIQLNIYTAGQGSGGAGGNIGELQFNNNGTIGGAANTFVTANGNVRFTNISNLKINGGSTGYYLQTDGSGNLTWAVGTANVSGNGTSAGSNNQIQLSDGAGNFKVGAGFSFDPSSNILAVPGNVVATNFIGPLSNGTSNIAIATSSNINLTVNGNVSAVVSDNQLTVPKLVLNSGNIGLGLNAGANSQSTFGIAIGNNAGFDLQGPNAIAIGYDAANLNQGYESIAIGTNAGANAQGNSAVAIGYLSGQTQGQAAVAIGPSAGESNQGEYSVAIGYRAGKLSQPNNSIIINAANATLDASNANAFYVKPVRQNSTTNVMYYNTFTGEISYDVKPPTDAISNGTSNVSIPTANGNILLSSNGNANIAVVTGTGVVVNGTLNATGVISGNGSGLSNITGANVVGTVANATYALNAGNATAANTASTVTSNAQPNITSLGTLTSLSLSSSNIELGLNAQADGEYAIAIGDGAVTANTVSTDYSIAVGYSTYAATTAVSLGAFAGKFVSEQASNATSSVTIGHGAGYGNNRGNWSVTVGSGSGTYQRSYSTALGSGAGRYAGSNSIAIGYQSSSSNTYRDNTIVLNATGANLSPTVANALFVKPIRNATQSNYLYYDATSGEITYDTGTGGSNTAAGANTQVQFNTANVLDASPNFTFNTATNNLVITGNVNATSFNGSGSGLSALNAGSLSTGTVPAARLSGSYAINVSSANTASTVTTAAQPNITSVGTLTSLTVSGNVDLSGNLISIGSAVRQDVAFTTTTSGNVNFSTGTYNTLICTQPATGNYRLNFVVDNFASGTSVSGRFVILEPGAGSAYGLDAIDPILVNGNIAILGANIFLKQDTPTVNGVMVYDVQLVNTGSGYITYIEGAKML